MVKPKHLRPEERLRRIADLQGPDRPRVHAGAFVDPNATIHATAEIGPGAVIGPDVQLGARVRVGPHAIIAGHTEIACDVRIFAGAVIGEEPQDRGFGGGRSYVRIGAGTQIREYVTIHRGTAPESETVVGADCFLMATCHVAHNCRLGDGVTIANGALLAGHVEIGDHTFLSGNVSVHQFVRIGPRVMVGANAFVTRDVAPFTMVTDREVCGLNLIGLRRAGVPRAAIAELHSLYGMFAQEDVQLSDRLDEVSAHVATEEGRAFIEFLRSPSKRGITPFLAR
jgi:UDP-N-acetylglucosamine acyltransferase